LDNGGPLPDMLRAEKPNSLAEFGTTRIVTGELGFPL